jgi:hypothetical protein
MRTARSRISGENFGDFLILAPFSSEGASAKPGAVHSLSFDENIESALFGLTTFYRCLKNSTDVRIVGLLAMKSATIFIPNADHLLPFFPWLYWWR